VALTLLSFDTDFDHPLESVQMGHPERVMPFCVREAVIARGAGVPVLAGGLPTDRPDPERVLCEVTGNHQSRLTLRRRQPVTTEQLEILVTAPARNVPAALFEVRCYATR
jgi:hypothetical protein